MSPRSIALLPGTFAMRFCASTRCLFLPVNAEYSFRSLANALRPDVVSRSMRLVAKGQKPQKLRSLSAGTA